MRTNKTGLAMFVGVFVLLAVPHLVKGQANRTWVSGVGDDTSPCSRTAPCKTFAGALVHTTTGGEVDCLDSGGFGSVTISKSVTLDGTGYQAGILASGTNGISINITSAADIAKSVRLRHLTINGLGNGNHGISIVSARRVFVDDVLIDGFQLHGIRVETERADVFVNSSIIRNIGKSAIDALPTSPARTTLVVEGSTLVETFAGLSVHKGVRATVRNSTISQNRNGVLAESGAELNALNCVFTENESAVTARDGSIIRLAEVSVIHNGKGLLVAGGKIIAFQHVLVNGNDTDGTPTSTVPTP